MAVYIFEIPNDTEPKISNDTVERIIAAAFEGRATGIQRKHLGTLKELAWEEEYNVTMGGG